MARSDLPAKASNDQVQDFLRKVAMTPVLKTSEEKGRLIFALDATASREPTWDRASHLQAEMFQETASLGGLEIQLAFYRGFGEFKATKWAADQDTLMRQMTGVYCLAGETQLRKVLRHAVVETKKRKVDALVFIGDCIEEDVDKLGAVAGELGILGTPAFLFQEGGDPVAEFAFRQIAKLTNGAYCPFDSVSAQTLRELLRAVAVFAAGGRKALENLANNEGGAFRQIAHQVKRG
ncbi:MAG: VWA domain-containing protein [Rhodospirillaceae bacterium]|nr:VWA domain-containing protein [Rhodospirillaceae bacterium]MBT4117234.1 VWA domain-containing protein [Rhodospirillaceae bacterium]MBT4674867.1 VWA domain-containing protein [Rhodospirillaceae bacterium]MBT4747891.1 VWA domain-containing protein [Rhodospirillaceae bacterium]MBT5179344.1 VWA domain-containing protein [Rhodospirillaceae bacterium]